MTNNPARRARQRANRARGTGESVTRPQRRRRALARLVRERRAATQDWLLARQQLAEDRKAIERKLRAERAAEKAQAREAAELRRGAR